MDTECLTIDGKLIIIPSSNIFLTKGGELTSYASRLLREIPDASVIIYLGFLYDFSINCKSYNNIICINYNYELEELVREHMLKEEPIDKNTAKSIIDKILSSIHTKIVFIPAENPSYVYNLFKNNR